MKLINRRNFISIVCISFTLVVCGKLLTEKIMGFTDKHYTENIFTCLAFSVLITSVLAAHYYLQRFPLIPVLIGQYAVIVGAVVGLVKIVDAIAGTETNAMWQMILSVTIPYIFSAVLYYISFFKQVRKANSILSQL
jgi:hypothetical protein